MLILVTILTILVHLGFCNFKMLILINFGLFGFLYFYNIHFDHFTLLKVTILVFSFSFLLDCERIKMVTFLKLKYQNKLKLKIQGPN